MSLYTPLLKEMIRHRFNVCGFQMKKCFSVAPLVTEIERYLTLSVKLDVVNIKTGSFSVLR